MVHDALRAALLAHGLREGEHFKLSRHRTIERRLGNGSQVVTVQIANGNDSAFRAALPEVLREYTEVDRVERTGVRWLKYDLTFRKNEP